MNHTGWLPGQLALAAVLVMLLITPAGAADERGIAFHMDSDAHANRSLRQISRQLEAMPDTPVHVVLIADAVNIVVEGAKDANGGLYSAQIEQLLASGVRFFACENTMTSFNLTEDDLAFGIETVPSGIVALSRLQLDAHFAYQKL